MEISLARKKKEAWIITEAESGKEAPRIDAAWKSLQEAGKVPGDIELDNFFDADADLVVHKELTDEGIIKCVCGLEKPSNGEDEFAQHTPALVASLQVTDGLGTIRSFLALLMMTLGCHC